MTQGTAPDSSSRRTPDGETATSPLAVSAFGGEVLVDARMVRRLIGDVSNATLYRMLASGQFPQPISVTPGRKAWPMSVVQAWIRGRIEQRQEVAAPTPTGRE
jgi:predicted DNA-binding transcriptional regulator AlpA